MARRRYHLTTVKALGVEPFTTAPPPLKDCVERRHATVVEAWREGRRGYARLASPSGDLFARWSERAADSARLAHERAVREVVGTSGPGLRAPAVLEWGELWMLEQGIVSEPFEGPPAVDAALTASAALARLRLPAPPGARQNPLLETASALAYRVRALKPPLPPSDLARARRMLHRTSLPLRTGHGDFHRDNLLLCDGVVWAVDWELSGLLPSGFDLCVLWASLDDPTDRDRLFEGAVAQVGEEARRDLAVLRYSLTVRTIASKLASPLPDNRDREGAAALVELLPVLRAEAGVSTARP